MTSKQVSEDNEKMSDTMYKLLKKYQAIRSIVKILHVSMCTSYLAQKFCGIFCFRWITSQASFTPFFHATTCSRKWSKMWHTTQITWNIDMNLESNLNDFPANLLIWFDPQGIRKALLCLTRRRDVKKSIGKTQLLSFRSTFFSESCIFELYAKTKFPQNILRAKRVFIFRKIGARSARVTFFW